MATYKKRGYKPPKEKIQDVEENNENEYVDGQSTTEEVFNTLDEGASRTETWVADNQKYIYIVLGIVVIAVLGYLGYEQWIQEPKKAEAANEMAQAQNYMQAAMSAGATQSDSLYNLALNGGEGKYGFLDIIDNYGGTPSANIASYNAGFAYLYTGKYQEAIDYLEDFKSEIKKTKLFNNFLVKMKLKNSIIISDKNSKTKIIKSARNIPNIKIIDQEGANAYDLLKYKNVIFTASSIKSFQERVTK